MAYARLVASVARVLAHRMGETRFRAVAGHAEAPILYPCKESEAHMTKTAKLSMVGVLVVALLALFAVSGCSGMDDNANTGENGNADNAANTDNGGNADGNAGDNADSDNSGSDNGGDNSGDNNNADNSQSGKVEGVNGEVDGTVLKVPNGWVAYSGGDMIALVDTSTEPGYEWTAEIDGTTVLKDTDADLPSSTYYDQSATDVVGAPGMHVFGFVADDQNNGDSTVTMKMTATESGQVDTTIVLKASVQNGAFTDVTVQES